MTHIPPLDPNVAAQKGFRESEERIKRFWKSAGVEARDGGWIVLLDGRAPKTPAGNAIVLPTEAAARLVADGRDAQGEHLPPATTPATRLASTATDPARQTRGRVAGAIARHAA